MNKVLFSSESDHWRTPKNLYEYFIKNGYIDLFKYKSNYNEFERTYNKCKLFINPPYSIINKKYFINWLDELIFKFDNDIFLLIPSRTDTELFYHLFYISNDIYFFKGRLHFNDSKNTAPFPSVLFHLNKEIRKKEIYNITLEDFICIKVLENE